MTDAKESTEGEAGGEWLRRYLAEHDAGCPACGYSLRGLAGHACPECGLEVVVKVAGAVPHRVYWWCAVWGLAWPLLINGIVTATWGIVMIQAVRSGTPIGTLFGFGSLAARLDMWFSAMMLALCVAGGVFLLATRRRPWRPRVRRTVFAAGVIVFAVHAFWYLSGGVLALLP